MEALIALILAYRYVVILPLAMFEGPILAFVGGSLVALGYFEPIPLFLVLVFADVVPDTVYYALGRYGSKTALVARIERRSNIVAERLNTVRVLWEKHTFKTMAVTKFAYGLSTPLLISAGLVHLPFRRFLLSTVPLSMLQYSVLLTLGYFYGNSLTLVENVITRVQITVAVVVLLGVVLYLFATRIRARLFVEESDA